MSTVIHVIGIISIILLCFGIVTSSIAYLVGAIKDLFVNLKYQTQEITRRDLGTQLIRESYWYSEDPSVVEALRAIGESLQSSGNYSISKARDIWRSKRDIK